MLCDGVNFDEDTPSYISKRIMDEFYSDDRQQTSIQDFFEAAIDKLDAEIVKFSNNGKAGTSLLACVIMGKELYIIGVGGARLYHIRGNGMKQLTSEHRYSIELEAKVSDGEIDAAEAANHPRRNELISYIGVGGIHYIDMNDMPIMLEENDMLFYCSDGLYNILDDSEMLAVINSHKGMFKNCAKELTAAAMDSSGGIKDDDISALLVKIGKQEEL
jgi:protein phosphatase